MKVKAIYKHNIQEYDLELSVGIMGEEHYISVYNKTTENKTGPVRIAEYTSFDDLDANWEIISKPEIYENYTGKMDYPLLREKYMELYQHVLSKSRERALLKIGL